MNRPRKHPGRLAAMAYLAAVLATAGPLSGAAIAQPAEQRPLPPRLSDEVKGKPLMTILTALILTGMVLGAAGMPSKRGHQD